MTHSWTEADLPELSGKTAIVTGGNSGIGLGAATALARRGATVIIACRDPKKAEAAVDSISSVANGNRVEAQSLDLSRLASVRAFSDAILARGEPIDLLVNNAGVMALPKSKTEDGFETQLGTNHLGHFALSLRLIPALELAPAARVVTVTSMTHTSGVVRFDDLHGDREYSPSGAYTQSKLANLLFAYELDRRLRATKRRTRSIACHPGWSATQITSGAATARGGALLSKVMVWGNKLVAQPADRGAWPTLFAATEPSLRGGEYIGPMQLFGTRGYPGIDKSSDASYDTAAAERLWTLSESMTGERFV